MKKSILLFVLLLTVGVILYHSSGSFQKEETSSIDQSPFGRDLWRNTMRTNEANPEKILKARKALQVNFNKSKHLKDSGLNRWTQLDTHEKAGRVRTIAPHPFDPDVLFTGGVSGGIWKTENAGASWDPVDDFMPSLSVTSIIIHPDHPDTMYAATGEGITGGREFTSSSPGAGIFRSVNGGDNWKLVGALDANNLEGFYWINKIAFDPSDPSIFYATKDGSLQESTTLGGSRLYKFENHGETKTEVNYNDLAGSLTNIVFNPSDPDDILLCSSDGLYISQDKGTTWENMNTKTGWPSVAGRVEVAMSVSASETIYALCEGDDITRAILLKSVDMGENWETLISGTTLFDGGEGNQGGYDNVIWVDPEDVDNVIVGGINLMRVIKVFVGGNFVTAFEPISDGAIPGSPHADQHVIVPASDYSSTNRRLYIGNDGGIARTDDFMTVTIDVGWELLNNGLYITQFYASDVDGPGPNRIIGGSQDNGTLLSEDMGASWTDEFFGDGGFCGFSQQDNDLIYVSMQNGRFFGSCINSSGAEYYAPVLLMDGQETNPPFIAPMKVYPQDGEKIIAGGENVYLVEFDPTPAVCMTTINIVNPFGSPSGETVTAIDINNTGDITIIGYSDGSVYRTTSLPGAAMFWNEIYQHPNSDPITDIAISPLNNNKVAISTGGYDDNIQISVNTNEIDPEDVVWQSRSDGIPALQVNTLVWHPEQNNWIYAGTDLGIMASENNGENWNISPNFMGVSDGPAFTEVSNLQFAQKNTLSGYTLVATTFGRGIWKTSMTVETDIYFDEDFISIVENGREGSPYTSIDKGENVQAHGQTWHIDSGNYPVDTTNKIIIDKRIGEVKLTGAGAITIGNN